MTRTMFLISLERLRRVKAAIKESPILVLGIICAIASAVYVCMGLIKDGFNPGEFFANKYAIAFVMLYLVGKIINPTQGFRTDYQFVELKLISWSMFKTVMGIKFLWGGAVFIIIGLAIWAKNLILIGTLNCIVNLWVYLRHKLSGRIWDILVAFFVLTVIYFELFTVVLIGLLLIISVYVLERNADYSELLPIYKLLYQIGQQRYLGASYSDNELNNIQVNVEKLTGKAKCKYTDWCERLYDRKRWFYLYKELSQIRAKKDSFFAYLLVNMLIGASTLYFDNVIVWILFFVQIMVAWNYSYSMNRNEMKLIRRGLIGNAPLKDIKITKFLVYTVMNFTLLLPIVLNGIIWILIALLTSLILTLFIKLKYLK